MKYLYYGAGFSHIAQPYTDLTTASLSTNDHLLQNNFKETDHHVPPANPVYHENNSISKHLM